MTKKQLMGGGGPAGAFIALVLGISLSATTSAEVLILQPGPGEGKDTFVWNRSGSQNQDLSSSNRHWTQHNTGSWFSRGYYEFDLSGMDSSATVANAELILSHLIFAQNPFPLPTFSFTLTEIAAPWDEATATWNNQATLGTAFSTVDEVHLADLSEDPSVQPRYSGQSTIDLTDLVTAWHEGTLPNNGFAYYMETSFGFHGGDHYIVSSDHEDPALRPRLAVTYVPEPGSSILFATAGLAFLVRRSRGASLPRRVS